MCNSLEGSQKRDRLPGDLFATRWHQPRQQPVQTQQTPESQCQPDIAKIPQSLETDALELDQNRFVVLGIVVVWRIKQGRLRTLLLVQTPAQLRPAVLLALLQFAEVRDHPVPRALGRADRFDQGPVGVSFAVLASFQSLEEHGFLAVDRAFPLHER